MTADLTMLEIKPTSDLPRWLRIVANPETDYLSVAMCAPRDKHRHLAFACAKRARCVFGCTDDTTSLFFVGDAHFEVTAQQAAEIARTFALGSEAA